MFFRLWVRAPRMTITSFDGVKGKAPEIIWQHHGGLSEAQSATSHSLLYGAEFRSESGTRDDPTFMRVRMTPRSIFNKRSKNERKDFAPFPGVRASRKGRAFTREAVLGSQSRAVARYSRETRQIIKYSAAHFVCVAIQHRGEPHQNFGGTCRALVCVIADRVAVLTKVSIRQWEVLEPQVGRHFGRTSQCWG